MKAIVKSILLFMAVCMLVSTLYGARPLSTDDAGIVEENTYELETGFNFFKQLNNSIERSIDYSLKYGISDRIDIGFAFSQEIPQISHFSSVEFSVKFLFYKSKSFFPDVALSVSTVPGDSNYTLNLIASKEVKNFMFHLNIGYSVDPIAANNVVNYSIALEYSLSEKVNIVSEICMEETINMIEKEVVNYLIGVTYQLNENIILDTGFMIDINKITTKYAATAGFTLGF